MIQTPVVVRWRRNRTHSYIYVRSARLLFGAEERLTERCPFCALLKIKSTDRGKMKQ